MIGPMCPKCRKKSCPDGDRCAWHRSAHGELQDATPHGSHNTYPGNKITLMCATCNMTVVQKARRYCRLCGGGPQCMVCEQSCCYEDKESDLLRRKNLQPTPLQCAREEQLEVMVSSGLVEAQARLMTRNLQDYEVLKSLVVLTWRLENTGMAIGMAADYKFDDNDGQRKRKVDTIKDLLSRMRDASQKPTNEEVAEAYLVSYSGIAQGQSKSQTQYAATGCGERPQETSGSQHLAVPGLNDMDAGAVNNIHYFPHSANPTRTLKRRPQRSPKRSPKRSSQRSPKRTPNTSPQRSMSSEDCMDGSHIFCTQCTRCAMLTSCVMLGKRGFLCLQCQTVQEASKYVTNATEEACDVNKCRQHFSDMMKVNSTYNGTYAAVVVRTLEWLWCWICMASKILHMDARSWIKLCMHALVSCVVCVVVQTGWTPPPCAKMTAHITMDIDKGILQMMPMNHSFYGLDRCDDAMTCTVDDHERRHAVIECSFNLSCCRCSSPPIR